MKATIEPASRHVYVRLLSLRDLAAMEHDNEVFFYIFNTWVINQEYREARFLGVTTL